MRPRSWRVFWCSLLLATAFCRSLGAAQLQLEIAADHPSIFQLFHSTGEGFNQSQSEVREFAGGGRFQTLTFTLPDRALDGLRLDPGSMPGRILFRNLRVLDASGQTVLVIPPHRLMPAHHILQAPPAQEGPDVAAFIVAAGSDDPILAVDDLRLTARFGGPSELVLPPAALGALGLLAAAVGLWGASKAVRATMPVGSGNDRAQAGWIMLGLFLLLAGLRLATFSQKISWAPYLDQFEGEWAEVIRPLGEGGLTLSDLFARHNDHRIVTTRLAAAGVQLLNGEWDNRILSVVGLLVQAATFAWFVGATRRVLPGAAGWLIAAVPLVWATLVSDWENCVNGFQLQFHLLILGAVIALYFLPQAIRSATHGGLGLLAALMAGLSMTSGLLAAIAAGAGLAWQLWHAPRARRSAWAVLAAAVVIAVVLFWTRARFPAHDFLRAADFGAWLRAWTAYAAWPLPSGAWSVAVLWSPWAWLVWRSLRTRATDDFTVFVVMLGFWMLLQTASLAWARAGTLPLVQSRYTGLLVWSVLANLTSLLLLTQPLAARRRPRLWLAGLTGATVIAVAVLAWRSGHDHPRNLELFRASVREHEARLGTYFRDDDPQVMFDVDFPRIPYPVKTRLVHLLRDPSIRAALPAPLRREQRRLRAPETIAEVQAGPLTHAARALLAHGVWLVLPGLGTLAISLARQRRGQPAASSPAVVSPG